MNPADAPPVCVFCRRHQIDPAWRPFCSQRCKLQDLAKWADGSYRVAPEPVPDPVENLENVEKEENDARDDSNR